MPALAQLQSELGDDGFKVLAINIDAGDDTKPKAFLTRSGVQSRLYRDATIVCSTR
jgi:cytochrome oxidase Cu insertion factor (SCO1/SenC/PrrC family)